MNTIELRKIVVSGSSAMFDVATGISHLKLQASVNSIPTLTVTSHAGVAADEGVNNFADNTHSFELAAAMQQRLFTSLSEPDTNIRIEDGNGGVVNFEGMSYALNTATSVGGVGDGWTVQQKARRISGLDTSIYMFDAVDPHKSSSKLEELPTGDVISERLRKSLSNMVKVFLDPNRGVTTSPDAESLQSLHESNLAGIDAFASIMERSVASTELSGWSQAETDGVTSAASNYTLMKNMYRSKTSDFFGSVLMGTFSSAFQYDYIPAYDTFGTIATKSWVFNNPIEKIIDSEDVTLRVGPTSFRQVTSVAVHGALRPVMPDVSNDTKISNAGVVYVYPEGAFSLASSYPVDLPPWLPTHVGVIAKTPEEVERVVGKGVKRFTLSSRTFLSSGNANILHTQTIAQKSLKTLISSWAKNVYLDVALAPSTVDVTGPLDVSWIPGRRYTVTVGAGKFSGILHSTTHTIRIAQQSATGQTALSFTHVLIDGFTPPGVD